MATLWCRRFGLIGLVAAAGLLAACGPSRKEFVTRGDGYAAKHQWAEAVLEYANALQSDPTLADVRLRLADVYLQLGDGQKALGETVRAADLLPRDVGVQIKAARLLLAAGQFEDARSRAQQILQLDPTNVDGQILLGNSQAGLRDFEAAITEYERVLAFNPSHDEAYANLGLVQAAKGDTAAAEAAFRKAVAVAPQSVPAHLALAGFLWSSNRTADAEAVLTATLALDPANVPANRALGLFYLLSPHPERAEPYFQTLGRVAPSAAAQFSLADYYIITNRNNDAVRILTELAKDESSWAQALTTLAAIDLARGRRAEALATIDRVLALRPGLIYARLLRTRLLLLENRRDEALLAAQKIVDDMPTSAAAGEAYTIIGRIQQGLDRRTEAIKAYEQVLTRQPRPLEATLSLANLHLAAGAYDKAEAYARQAMTIDPSNVIAHELMIRVLTKQKLYNQARQELADLAAIKPGLPVLGNLAAGVQLGEGQVDAARISFQRVLDVAPGNVEATSGLVKIDLDRGRPNDAITRVELALARVTPSADLLLLAGHAYINANQPAKAEAVLKRAIAADPARLEAYNLLGQLYLTQQRVDEAKKQFEDMLKRNPQSVSATTMLAMLFEAQRNTAEAERLYRKVLALDNRAAVAANNLAWLLVSGNGNLDDALSLAQMAHRLQPDEPHIADTLGWIYSRKNIPSPAVRLFEGSLEKDATDPVVHYHLGVAYAQLGQKEKARTALRRALSMQSNFEGAAEARRTLSQLGG